LDDAIELAALRIQIDQHEIRAIERTHAAHPGILIDAAEIRQIEERRAIFGQHKARGGFLVVGVNRLDADPRGDAVVRVLLEEKVSGDAVWVSLERKGAVFEIWE